MKNLKQFLDEQLKDPNFVSSYINELKEELEVSRDKIQAYQKQIEKERTEKKRLLARLETMQQELTALKKLDNKKHAENKYISKDTEDAFFKEPNLSHLKKSLKQLKKGQGTVHDLLDDN